MATIHAFFNRQSFNPQPNIGAALIRVFSIAAAVTMLAASCGGGSTDPGNGEGEGPGEMAMLDGFYVVESGETLSGILRQECGESSPELLLNIVDANRSNQQLDGEYLDDVDRVEAGWVLQIPCELPLRPLVDCPESAETLFAAQGDGARVLLCQTGETTEYFGQRLNDRASTIIDACRRQDGLVEAFNPAPTVDTFYLVQTGQSPRVEIRQGPTGTAALDAGIIADYDLEGQLDNSDGNLRSCSEPAPPPIEEQNINYPLDLAPLTSIVFDQARSIPDDVPCDGPSGGLSTLPNIIGPRPTSADPDRWLSQAQGDRLYLSDLPANSNVVLAGGGHQWPMQPSFEDVYSLDLTDAHPLGRYVVKVVGSDEPSARVEIVEQDQLLVRVDHFETAGNEYLYRIYGMASGRDLSIRVAQADGCNGVKWHEHQAIGSPSLSNSGVAKLGLDLRAAPNRFFCLAIDDQCHVDLYPGL